jgi:hypothetical protein
MDRREMLGEISKLKNEIVEMQKRLDKMEAHEGEDGTPEDVDGQCKLVDEIAAKSRRMWELRRLVYPK